MIVAVDTNVLARALDGLRDRSTTLLREALRTNSARLPPIVVTEMLSNPRMTEGSQLLVRSLPQLEVFEGMWERAGLMRADLKRRGFKAAVGDCIIAQCCIDHGLPLLTFDRDFRHFTFAGLKLL